VPMITIQQILLHESLSTTERYLHSLGDLRKALESIF
jgi:site-specific recombinase XerD